MLDRPRCSLPHGWLGAEAQSSATPVSSVVMNPHNPHQSSKKCICVFGPAGLIDVVSSRSDRCFHQNIAPINPQQPFFLRSAPSSPYFVAWRDVALPIPPIVDVTEQPRVVYSLVDGNAPFLFFSTSQRFSLNRAQLGLNSERNSVYPKRL